MSDPFAIYDDVVTRWPAAANQVDAVNAKLDDASAFLRSRFPGIDDQIDSGVLDLAAAKAVACGLVIRAMMRADGVVSESEGTGPYSHSATYSNPAGNFYLTDADLTLILGYRPRAQSLPMGC